MRREYIALAMASISSVSSNGRIKSVGTPCGARGLGRLVHLRGGDRAVVAQDQGVGQLLRVVGVDVGREVEEQGVHPRAEGSRGLSLDAVRGGFGGGVHEGAAAVFGLGEQGAEDVVDGQDPRARVGVGFDAGGDLIGPRAVTMGEVLTDEVLLAGEGVVERALGYAGAGDDAVDADGVDALVVEQVVGRLQDALLGAAMALLGLGHVPHGNRRICLNKVIQTSLPV